MRRLEVLESLVLLTESVEHLIPVHGADDFYYLSMEVIGTPWRDWGELDPYHPVRVDGVFQLRIYDIAIQNDPRGSIVGAPPQHTGLDAIVLDVDVHRD